MHMGSRSVLRCLSMIMRDSVVVSIPVSSSGDGGSNPSPAPINLYERRGVDGAYGACF